MVMDNTIDKIDPLFDRYVTSEDGEGGMRDFLSMQTWIV